MQNDIDKPISRGTRTPLPSLPDREWLKVTLINAIYHQAKFNGVDQFLTDQNKVEILDADGKKIERMEFELTFALKDFALSNGEPRRLWLRLGASLSTKANLPIFLFNIGFPRDELAHGEITPPVVINYLKNHTNYKLQIGNKPNPKDPAHPYQNVLFDAVKLDE